MKKTTDETMTVRLTLRRHVAEKLRRICHNRGLTASLIVDGWIFEHDERGKPLKAPETPPRSPIDDLMDVIRSNSKKT